MLTLRRPTTYDLSRLLDEQSTKDLTYEAHGATLAGDLPEGYRHDRVQVALGNGAETFNRAKAALADWAPQRRSGLDVLADAPLATGTCVALVAPLPVGFAVAACRVVAVVDDGTRFGFAYGTLPEHPEEGEELFLLDQDRDGSVRFEIVAFSRPHDALTRLAGPIARALQIRATKRYLTAMTQQD